jgi:hypothetical protein
MPVTESVCIRATFLCNIDIRHDVYLGRGLTTIQSADSLVRFKPLFLAALLIFTLLFAVFLASLG